MSGMHCLRSLSLRLKLRQTYQTRPEPTQSVVVIIPHSAGLGQSLSQSNDVCWLEHCSVSQSVGLLIGYPSVSL